LSVCWHFQRGHDQNALQTIELPLLWQPDPVEWDLCRASLLHLAQAWYGTADYRRLTADVSMTEDYAAFALSSGADLNAEWLRDSLSRVLFGVCWKQCEARSTHRVLANRVLESSMPQWLLAVVQRMHDNPARSVEEIAHDVGISTPQLRKAFRRHFNTSPRSYMNARRLEAARHLLNSTVLPLRDIGAQLGFGSIPHFNRSFKNAFGTPPARYREMSHRDASCSA
jgi:AraC-like DNA-binding protein